MSYHLNHCHNKNKQNYFFTILYYLTLIIIILYHIKLILQNFTSTNLKILHMHH